MKITIYLPEGGDPIQALVDVPAGQSISTALDLLTSGEHADLCELFLDSAGFRRYTSVYLGVPGEGVRNVKLAQGMQTAIKSGEELTILIAGPPN